MVLCMSSMILGGCIPSPKKQTEAITVEENPNMMYMLVGSYATPEEEGIKVYNFSATKVAIIDEIWKSRAKLLRNRLFEKIASVTG